MWLLSYVSLTTLCWEDRQEVTCLFSFTCQIKRNCVPRFLLNKVHLSAPEPDPEDEILDVEQILYQVSTHKDFGDGEVNVFGM